LADEQNPPADGDESPDTRPEKDGLRDISGGRLIELPIEQELKDSYLPYAMSVIVSRALPDVRDGLKPLVLGRDRHAPGHRPRAD